MCVTRDGVASCPRRRDSIGLPDSRHTRVAARSTPGDSDAGGRAPPPDHAYRAGGELTRSLGRPRSLPPGRKEPQLPRSRRVPATGRARTAGRGARARAGRRCALAEPARSVDEPGRRQPRGGALHRAASHGQLRRPRLRVQRGRAANPLRRSRSCRPGWTAPRTLRCRRDRAHLRPRRGRHGPAGCRRARRRGHPRARPQRPRRHRLAALHGGDDRGAQGGPASRGRRRPDGVRRVLGLGPPEAAPLSGVCSDHPRRGDADHADADGRRHRRAPARLRSRRLVGGDAERARSRSRCSFRR